MFISHISGIFAILFLDECVIDLHLESHDILKALSTHGEDLNSCVVGLFPAWEPPLIMLKAQAGRDLSSWPAEQCGGEGAIPVQLPLLYTWPRAHPTWLCPQTWTCPQSHPSSTSGCPASWVPSQRDASWWGFRWWQWTTSTLLTWSIAFRTPLLCSLSLSLRSQASEITVEAPLGTSAWKRPERGTWNEEEDRGHYSDQRVLQPSSSALL